MTDQERSDRIVELTGLIAKARDDYYNKQPTVSDEVYDAWSDELSDLDALSQILTTVGAPPVSEWAKTTHENPMGSLDKVNALEEMTDWVQTYASGEPLLISEKLDGVSIKLQYVGGKLVKAATRGDGFIGEDITINAQRMKGVLAKLPKKLTCTFRGEIVLLKSDLANHFKSEYANTRNAVSGIAKRYDGKGCDYLTVMLYKVMSGVSFATSEEQFKFIESLGFLTPNWFLSGMWMGVKTPQDLWVEYQQSRRDKLDYDIDGLVIEINDQAKQFALGEHDLRPFGAVAFKFAPITRETQLTGFTLQTGATGHITPVANFDPVNLLGAQVSNASLYNWRYIQTLGLDVGARILVARANDVIPRVVAVVKSTGTIYPPPTSCPSCGGEVVQEGEFHSCANRGGCPAQVVGRLSQWLSNLGILEWGDVLLEKLSSAGLAKSVPDLYRLTEAQVAGLDRMGATSAAKALKLLNGRKVLPLDLLLGSLSIPGIATSTVKLLMDAGFDSFEKLSAASLDKLVKVKGIGPVRANTLYSWIKSSGSIVQELSSVGVQVQEPIRGKFSGMYFCFTGTMNTSRGDLEAMVKSNGGEVKSSVTKKLTYLILADTNTTKATKAREYGTKCLSEDEFLSLVSG